jgi:hypothetical protein
MEEKMRKKILGIWMMIIGIAFQFLNMITYGLWGIDIDILGALIFIIGLVLTIIGWSSERKKKGKKRKKK